MKFVIILGPQAVGKMTVGHELEKITGLKLFHNHMTIEFVTQFFSYGTPAGKRLVKLFRDAMFREVAASDLPGLIFTYVCAFNEPKDWEYVKNIAKIFTDKGGEVYYVELEADEDERLRRNKTEHRLVHKPTKRDTALSEERFKESMQKYRMNSLEGEIQEKHYLRIDNTHLEPATVARQIKETFDL